MVGWVACAGPTDGGEVGAVADERGALGLFEVEAHRADLVGDDQDVVIAAGLKIENNHSYAIASRMVSRAAFWAGNALAITEMAITIPSHSRRAGTEKM